MKIPLAILIAFLPLAVAAQDERASVEAFVAEFQRACARDDREAIAAMIRYPITVRVGGMRVPVTDAATFVSSYNLIVTPEMRAKLACLQGGARGRAPALPRVDVEGGLASVAEHTLRLERTPAGWQIVAMNVPAPDAPADGAAQTAPSQGPATRAQRGGITAAPGAGARRIVLRVYGGRRQTRLSGALDVGASDAYLLRAAQGELIEVAIEGVKGREVVAHVRGPDGAPVDARAGEGVRTWRGRAPAAGDYRIEIARTTREGPVAAYIAVVSLR